MIMICYSVHNIFFISGFMDKTLLFKYKYYFLIVKKLMCDKIFKNMKIFYFRKKILLCFNNLIGLCFESILLKDNIINFFFNQIFTK